MKRITPSRIAIAATLFSALAASLFSTPATAATPNPTSAVVKERIFNDCPFTTLTVVNNYPSLISFEDDHIGCFGFANLHNWTLSTDGVDGAVFNNDSDFRISADLVLEGDDAVGGEAGLRISPWYGKDVDGRFNIRIPDGEIACFGGALPFFSFTGTYGLHYVAGEPIHLEMTYKPHHRTASSPATLEYELTYQGATYSSGALVFGEQNASEDPPHGVWGMLNDGRVGGYVQPRLDGGNLDATVKATFTNIRFVVCPVEPDPKDAIVKTRIFNDCPFTTVTVVDNYPAEITITDDHIGCFGFANLHNWTFADAPQQATRLYNDEKFEFAATLVLDGDDVTGGEAGLRLSPWYGQDVDGRFNIRIPDGEIACFGGALPFYSFSNPPHSLRYAAGEAIRLSIAYDGHSNTSADPGTIVYTLEYQGNTYSSGVLPFGEQNASEDPPHGVWGIMNDARAGGYVQPRLDGGNLDATVSASFTDITFHAGADVGLDIKPEALNLSSNGKWVTAYIDPADPHGVDDVDLGSIRINGQVLPDVGTATVVGDRIRVKVDRNALLASGGGGSNFTITGEVGDPHECFLGTGSVKVAHVSSPHGGQVVAPGGLLVVGWDTPAGIDVESAAVYTSVDDGETWQLKASGLSNTGHYNLIVPETSTSTARVAIGLVSADHSANDAIGVSEPFTIGAPTGVGGQALQLALRGPLNNPSRDLTIGFTLPNASRATLAVFDVTGRQVTSREVGVLGAGSHTLKVADRLPAGVYLVKLNQGAASLTTRAVVVQ